MTTPLSSESLIAKFTSCRWRLGYMSLMCLFIAFTFRNSFSFAIVCMDKRVVVFSNVTTTDNETSKEIVTNTSVTKVINPYIPAELKGLVLSCYFYGYLITPLIGGYLAAKFGPKLLIGLAMTVSVVVMVVLPITLRTNIYIAVALRFVMGFVSGTVIPATQVLLSNWAPITERTLLAATSNSGINVANIVSTAVSGFLCQIPVEDGWPLIFYVYGGAGALWLLFWMMLVHDSPDLHPGCTQDEKRRIYHGKMSIKSSVKALPWKRTLRNPPFWALVTNHIAYSWITNTLQTFLPMYMSDVLRFEISENGVFSSLPSIGRLFGVLVFSFLADRIILTTSMSIGTNRKIFQSLGTIGPGVTLIGLSYLNSDQRYLAVGLMILTMTMQAGTAASFRVNHLDIAPRYAGQVMGFTLTCGCCSAIVSPLVTSAITIDRTREQWQTVFFLTAGIVIAADMFFVIFASGQEQDWAKADDESAQSTRHITATSMSGTTQKAAQIFEQISDISDKRNGSPVSDADDLSEVAVQDISRPHQKELPTTTAGSNFTEEPSVSLDRILNPVGCPMNAGLGTRDEGCTQLDVSGRIHHIADDIALAVHCRSEDSGSTDARGITNADHSNYTPCRRNRCEEKKNDFSSDTKREESRCICKVPGCENVSYVTRL